MSYLKQTSRSYRVKKSQKVINLYNTVQIQMFFNWRLIIKLFKKIIIWAIVQKDTKYFAFIFIKCIVHHFIKYELCIKNEVTGSSIFWLSTDEPPDNIPLFHFSVHLIREILYYLLELCRVPWLHDNIQDNFVNSSQVQNFNFTI